MAVDQETKCRLTKGPYIWDSFAFTGPAHEAVEWFKFNGECLKDPHPELRKDLK